MLSMDPLERQLQLTERQRFKEAKRRATELGTEIRGFYHTSAWQGHWRDIVTEQLQMIDGHNFSSPSLLKAVDQLQVVIADSNKDFATMENHIKSLNLRFRKKIKFLHNATVERAAFKEANQTEKAKLMERVPLNVCID
jgi:hypothetical protein